MRPFPNVLILVQPLVFQYCNASIYEFSVSALITVIFCFLKKNKPFIGSVN